MKTKTAAIVGAGISGLYCAKILSHKLEVTVFDKNDQVGGRIQTDQVDGFLLDHGFQVLQPAYSEAIRAFDYRSLDLHYFGAGAKILFGKTFHEVSDPFREPLKLLKTLSAPIGSLLDKLRILKLRFVDPKDSRLNNISTIKFLEEEGFSPDVIARFFGPFFSGVFLERELKTPASFFAYLYRLFSISEVAVPKHGMGQLAFQLADDSSFSIRLGESADIQKLRSSYDYVIQAHNSWKTGARKVTTDYFISKTFNPKSPILYLNGNQTGIINHLAPMSTVSKAYSSDGKSLLSVNLLEPNTNSVVTDVHNELAEWFAGHHFEHLARYQIENALPVVDYSQIKSLHREGVYYCGDGEIQPSIQGALVSGRKVAEKIISLL